MNKNRIRIFENIFKQRYIKIIIVIIIVLITAGVTIWLCDNFPYLIKRLILVFS